MQDSGASFALHLTVAVLCVLVGLGAWAVALSMGNPLGQPVGPGYVPAALGLALSVLGAAEAVMALRGRTPHAGPSGRADAVPRVSSPGLTKWAALAAAEMTGLWLWGRFGYWVGALVLVLGFAAVDTRVSMRRAVPYCLLVTGVVWALFERILKVPLG